eukprot:gnl/Spiro4/3928_TR1952_c0_g2_i1.p1 gnl/Spiro4/3928_TR1952_c0_g2~~gnl/Spiro4/3928_TR1952_c0_g2_i1.p1  ORF type:complete len:181 (+),score=47.81 gnl/Spiro4/3928_TR1952_c0_g2_i1:35-544(+)
MEFSRPRRDFESLGPAETPIQVRGEAPNELLMLRNCHDCAINVVGSCAKVICENLQNVQLVLDAGVLSRSFDIIGCSNCSFTFARVCETIQCDSSQRCVIQLHAEFTASSSCVCAASTGVSVSHPTGGTVNVDNVEQVSVKLVTEGDNEPQLRVRALVRVTDAGYPVPS